MSTCAYNRAVHYLMDKCGKVDCGLTSKATHDIIKSRNKKESDTIRDNESNHIFTYRKPEEGFTTEYRIHLLLGQYYYGIAAQKELENLMNNLEMSN